MYSHSLPSLSRSLHAALRRGLALVMLALMLPCAHAADKVVFQTSWFAQAEHGGFYQALATGLYKQAGLDVTIQMGGPQVNGMQLLTAGQADLILSYDFQILSSTEKGLPVVAVAAAFQKDLQGMMAHGDVKSLSELKGKTLLVANVGRVTWWPWLKTKYGYSDEQVRPYTFNMQPFFADANTAQQAYPSSEPFQAMKKGVPYRFFLFADEGYPPYGTTIVTTQAFLKAKPDVVKRFVQASMQGWVDYLKNPAPANALIKRDNPAMTDEQIAFGVTQMKAMKVLDSGDAATQGVGTMSEARWERSRDYLVKEGLLKPDAPWRKAFTLDVVRSFKVMP